MSISPASPITLSSPEKPSQEQPKPKNKGGRPKGSKTRPQWLRDALLAEKKASKRKRGRPHGAKQKPKTLEALIKQSLQPKPPKPKKAPNPNPNLHFARLARENPEKLKELSAKGVKSPGHSKRVRPPGLGTQMTVRDYAVSLDAAQKLARKIMAKMDKKGDLPENAIARQAMEKTIELLAADIPVKDKISVIRTLLEYNMAKPAATQNLNVKTAEDFLDELANEGG